MSESVSESTSESASSSSSESTSTEAKFEARYQVEKSGGGTLTTGDSTGNNSVSYKVNDPGKSITVTAVPAEGHVFVKWSDGVTSKTRTDTNFKQNLDVTAIFGAASVRITSEGHATLGSAYTFKASLNGKYASAENLHWYANGAEIKAAASITVKVDASMLNTSYKIHAAIVYNGSTVNSNSLAVSIDSGVTSESGSQSGSSSGSTSSSSSSSASSGSSSSSASSTSEAASSSHAESHSTSASESKAEPKSEAASSSEAKSETSSSSKSESTSSSENDVAPSASSNTEASASKEAPSTAE